MASPHVTRQSHARNAVGVVIPTLGERAEWLRDCIESVLAQDCYPTHVLLVGPGNELLRSLSAEYKIELIEAEPRGLSNAINTGFSALLTDCAFVTWLGDDDLLAPGSLEAARSRLKVTTANFVYGNTRYIDAQGASIYVSKPTSVAPWYMRFGKDFVPQPGSLIRSDSISRRPVVDESLKNSMDLELFLYLSRPGRKSWSYVNQELSAYRLHPGAITSQKGVRDESDAVRNEYQPAIWKKMAPAWVPIRKFAEKALVWVQWRVSKPPVPLLNGREYIEPGAASGTISK